MIVTTWVLHVGFLTQNEKSQVLINKHQIPELTQVLKLARCENFLKLLILPSIIM